MPTSRIRPERKWFIGGGLDLLALQRLPSVLIPVTARLLLLIASDLEKILCGIEEFWIGLLSSGSLAFELDIDFKSESVGYQAPHVFHHVCYTLTFPIIFLMLCGPMSRP